MNIGTKVTQHNHGQWQTKVNCTKSSLKKKPVQEQIKVMGTGLVAITDRHTLTGKDRFPTNIHQCLCTLAFVNAPDNCNSVQHKLPSQYNSQSIGKGKAYRIRKPA
ncbi:hypothetical protein CS542_01095 [Pedobacter sp. IW39]|nr:hypothetical protein CS542_01095 [Pedobacter sp. IW39]